VTFERDSGFDLILIVLHRAQTLVVFAAHPLCAQDDQDNTVLVTQLFLTTFRAFVYGVPIRGVSPLMFLTS